MIQGFKIALEPNKETIVEAFIDYKLNETYPLLLRNVTTWHRHLNTENSTLGMVDRAIDASVPHRPPLDYLISLNL